MGARSLCMALAASPENQDGSSLPRVRSDLSLAADMMGKNAVRQSLLPSLAIHTGNQPAAPPQHSPVVTRPELPCQGAEHCRQTGCQCLRSTAFTPWCREAWPHYPTGASALKTILKAPRKFVLNDTCAGIPGDIPSVNYQLCTRAIFLGSL